RHLILAAAFMILLALPLAIWLAPSVEVQVPRLPKAIPAGFFDPAGAITPATVELLTTRRSDLTPLPPPPILALTWAIGRILLSLPVAAGLWQLRRIRRSASAWSRSFAISDASVDVLVHDAISGPMTCGVVRPVVLFPRDAETWDDFALKRALIHELEHVRR